MPSHQSNYLRRNVPYPLADEYRFKHGSIRLGELPNLHNVRAVWTGEKRKPRKGDWYLSGAIIEAYLSPAELDYVLPIAKLVTVKVETTTTITGDYAEGKK